MQIVIDIDKEDFEIIKHNIAVNNPLCPLSQEEMVSKVAKGTPLPKGHGRLVDVGQCDRKLFYQQCGGANSLITVKTAFDMLLSLPTIIEADKESEG